MREAIVEIINMSWPTIVIVLSIILIMRVALIFNPKKPKFHLYDELLNLLFVVYLMSLFELVTSQDIQTIGGTNLTPFKEIFRYDISSKEFIKQVCGNILMFFPLGYFVTRTCKLKSRLEIIVISLLSSLSIEVVQHFIGRSFDIDDVILNIVGGLLGYSFYKLLGLINRKLPEKLQTDWFYNSVIIFLFLIGILFLVKII